MNKTFSLLIVYFALLPAAWAAEDTITVTVTGFGQTAEGAEKSAIQKAVRKALGEFVDAETLTNNEEIIKDQVLTYSDGFVQSKAVVSGLEKDPDLGLFTITIRAVVVRNKVVERLREVKIAVTEVSGENLWAEAVSKVESVQDGRALLKKFLWEEMLPERLLGAQLVSKGADGKVIRGPEAKPLQKTDYDNGTVDLTFHIETFYHLEDYDKKVAPRLLQLLDKICKQKIEQGAPVAMERPGTRIFPKAFCTGSPSVVVGAGRRSLHSTPGSQKMYIGQWSKDLGSLKVSENMAFVACNVGRDRSGRNQRFTIYALDADAYARIFLHAPGVIIPRINLVLEDGDGTVIRHERWFPRKCVFTNVRREPTVELTPAFDGIGTAISRDYQSAYGISDKVSYGLVSMGYGRGGEKHFTIAPWFSFESASDFITAAPVLERKLTLDQADVKRLKRVKVFYEGLGLPKE